MQQQDERARLSAAYRRFAADEARGRSPLYEELARGVAADSEILDFLLALPRPKRQPNLLFAAARSLLGTPDGWNRFRRGVMQRKDALHALMLMRSTQTNEPGRCAALLPVLARLPQPLALLEVGASAGLCLLPDRYGYDYGGGRLMSARRDVEPPIFPCAVNAATPIPEALPSIAWRAGLDLEPVDIADRNQVAWLETLVWPEQTDRLTRLRAALDIAATRLPQRPFRRMVHEGEARNLLTPELIEAEVERSRRHGHTFAVVMLDVDHFKKLNDIHGHQTGDELLRQVARILAGHSREFDTTARYGGEEFAVILPSCGPTESVEIAERLRRLIGEADSAVAVTVSVGVATFPGDAPDAVTLIGAADMALYESKRAGRNRVTAASTPPGGVSAPAAEHAAPPGNASPAVSAGAADWLPTPIT